MPILSNVTSFEDRVVDTGRNLQRPVLDTVRKGVERAEGRLPKLRVPALPRVDLPRVDLPRLDLPRVDLPRPQLPSASRFTRSPAVRSQVDFAKALLDSQRTFVGELADALSPLVARDADEKSASVTKGIAETPAKKTSPKRKSTRSSKAGD
jgi:hypothetical protein